MSSVGQTSIWLRIYRHELSRRERTAKEDPKLYWDMYRKNLKPLDITECKDKHVWLPATLIWLHDGVKKGQVELYGYMRRSFSEALPFKLKGYHHVPQICWNCRSTRESISKIMTHEERNEARKLQKKNRELKVMRSKPSYQSEITTGKDLDNLVL